jgi:hypothetical protein
MISFSPTLKVYASGYKGIAKYSAGVGIYLATGRRDYLLYGSGAYFNEAVHHAGFFVHNALNINASDDLYIAFEASTGYYNYYVPASNISAGRVLLGTGLRFGYRF